MHDSWFQLTNVTHILEVPNAMPESKSRTGLLSVCGLVAILVSLGMIVMGLLHAAPIDSKASGDGVTRQNCTVIMDCGTD